MTKNTSQLPRTGLARQKVHSRASVAVHSSGSARLPRNRVHSSGPARKGQFILLSGFVFLMLLLLALPRQKELVSSSPSDLSLLAENVVRELPRAYNFGLNESAPVSRLVNFSRFAQQTLRSQFINLSHIWIVSQVDPATNNLNLSAGNFLEQNVTASLNLSGTVQNITITMNATNNTIFSSVSTNPFNITIQVGSDIATVQWQRDKNNMFAIISLKRETQYIREEVNA